MPKSETERMLESVMGTIKKYAAIAMEKMPDYRWDFEEWKQQMILKTYETHKKWRKIPKEERRGKFNTYLSTALRFHIIDDTKWITRRSDVFEINQYDPYDAKQNQAEKAIVNENAVEEDDFHLDAIAGLSPIHKEMYELLINDQNDDKRDETYDKAREMLYKVYDKLDVDEFFIVMARKLRG